MAVASLASAASWLLLAALSTALATRIVSAVAAAHSMVRSANTFCIKGWLTKVLPNASRWRTWCKAWISDCRISADEPIIQSNRVSDTISMITGTPRPSSPIKYAVASWNSTSDDALLQSPSLSFKRWIRTLLSAPFSNNLGSKKQLSPPSACASIRWASHIGAEKKNLCPTIW